MKRTWQDVERLKAQGEPRRAGELAYKLGFNESYGCHPGFRSTYDACREAFATGYWMAHAKAMKTQREREAFLREGPPTEPAKYGL